jgi:hypothetical protein
MTEFWNLFTLDCNCSMSLLGYISVEQFFLTNIFVGLNSFIFIVVNMSYSQKLGNLYLMSLPSLSEWWPSSWELGVARSIMSNFSLPPPTFFHPPIFQFCLWLKSLGSIFRTFFDLNTNSERVFRNFFQIYTGKSSGSKFRTFVCLGSRVKMKNWGMKKSSGGGKRKIQLCLSLWGISTNKLLLPF